MQRDRLRIREAEPGDAEALAVVHEASWCNAYQGLLPHAGLKHVLDSRSAAFWRRAIAGESGLLVLEYDGRVVGYVNYGLCSHRSQLHVRAPGRYGELFELYLHPVFQGIGFGSRLFEAARHQLIERVYHGFFVRALVENDAACRFYERRGGRMAFADVELFGGVPFDTVSYFWRLKNADEPLHRR